MLRDQSFNPDPIIGLSGDFFIDHGNSMGVRFEALRVCREIAEKGFFKLVYVEPIWMTLPGTGQEVRKYLDGYDIPFAARYTVDPMMDIHAFNSMLAVHDFTFAPILKNHIQGYRDEFEGDAKAFGDAMLHFYRCPEPYSREAFMAAFIMYHGRY